MEEQQLPPAIPLGKSVVNALSAPNDAFDGLASSAPSPTLWVVPLVVSVLFVVLFSYVFSSNETFREQLIERQSKVMQKQVEQGKMTQERADMAAEQMQKMGGMFMAIGSVVGTIFVGLYYFGSALALWLAGKFLLKSQTGYGKYLEAYGIANWIGVLGAVVTLLTMLAFNSMYATPSAALAVLSAFDPTNTTHMILSHLNVFTIWQAVVVGFAVAKLSGKSTGAGIGVTFGLWIVWVALTMALGINT